VSSSSELEEWVALTDRIYAELPQFVPPIRAQIRDLLARTSPAFRHGDVELLSIVRDEAVSANHGAHELEARRKAR